MKKDKKIAIILGSKSDLELLKDGFHLLEELNVPYRLEIISAHRDPDKLRKFCKEAKASGIEVIVACCGLSAALPGFVASYVDIPVIGVPLEGGVLKGIESLLSIVEVPKGLGLVGTGIGKKGFINALVFSFRLLSLKYPRYYRILKKLRDRFKR